MPFTAAHPAAVLPLRNRFPSVLPWSALVVGAIAPDLEYFFMGTLTVDAHSLHGVLTFCVPIGVLAWAAFHFLMKRPLVYLLPEGAARRLWPGATRRAAVSVRSLAAVVLAILVGTTTHIVWDAFTHDDRWGAHYIHALSWNVVTIYGYDVTVGRILQLASTFFGMAVLAVAFARWYRDQRPDPDTPVVFSTGAKLAILSSFVVASTIAALAWTVVTSQPIVNADTLESFVWRFITSGIGFACLCTLLYSAAVVVAERQLARIRT